MNELRYQLPEATIEWQNGVPWSDEFKDVYWSRDDDRTEKQHVYLEGNHLQKRWQQLQPGDQFTIVETGFGFGLSFLLTLAHWRKHAPAGCRLHYVAFEIAPVPKADLAKLASRSLDLPFDELLEAWPNPTPGAHYRHFNGGVSLGLVYGDIEHTLPQANFQWDACYLDGFSPATDHRIWSHTNLARLSHCARPGATLTSYSVAQAVRLQLARLGMLVEKRPGFGSKKYCLLASDRGAWKPTPRLVQKVDIVGAGVAGLLIREALTLRGIKCRVFEQSEHALGAVTQVQQVSVYPRLHAKAQPASLLSLRAFEYALRQLPVVRCGRLELPFGRRTEARIAAIAGLVPGVRQVDALEASALAGIKVTESGLLIEQAGWLSPATALNQQDIEFGQTWHHPQPDADATILATGMGQLAALAPLKLQPIRGQCLLMSAETLAPRMIVASEHAWLPAGPHGATLGSTYQPGSSDPEVNESEHDALLSSIATWVKPLGQHRAGVGIRTSTRDRLPIVGALPDWEALAAHCRASGSVHTFNAYQPKLYCAVGFGSHGFTFGPLMAELLARQINHEPLLEPMDYLAPSRFMFRDQHKGRLD